MSYLPRLNPFTRLACLMFVGLLASCGSTSTTASLSSTSSPSPAPAPPPVEPASPATAAATISEIQYQPVWVTLLNATEDIAATEQMGLRIGETIRTQGEASAQIDLKNGLALRIGGSSVLTLEPENRLYLKSGELIAWVKPGQESPVEIITPDAIAEINGSTVSVSISDSPKAETELFVWEGTVTLKLPDQSGEVQLRSGETVSIKRGEADISQIRRSVRQLSNPEWLRRRYQSRLLNNFGQSIPTQTRIDQTLPSVERLSSLPSIPASKPAPRPPKNAIASSARRNYPAPPRVVPPSYPTPENTSVPQPESTSAWKPITKPLPELPLNSVPTLQQELSGPIWQPTPEASSEPASSPPDTPEAEPDTSESQASPEKSETSEEQTVSDREIDAPSTTLQGSSEESEAISPGESELGESDD